MKNKLMNHFLKIGPRRFVVMTVLVLIVTDLINCYYLKLYWINKSASILLVEQALRQNNATLGEFSPSTVSELTAFVNNSFYFFLMVIVANNLFFYFFYLRKKLWAQGFVLFYTITAALLSATFIVDNANLGWYWMLYNILTIPLYLYLFLGVKLLKKETTLIPVDETTVL